MNSETLGYPPFCKQEKSPLKVFFDHEDETADSRIIKAQKRLRESELHLFGDYFILKEQKNLNAKKS